MKEKLETLNLLPLTMDLVRYLCDQDPFLLDVDLAPFEYVCFYKTKPYLYTRDYIEKNSLEFLIEEFDKIKNL